METPFFSPFPAKSSKELEREVIGRLGKDKVLDIFKKMLLSRRFDTFGEAAYRLGLVGGFYHASIGQEAISTAAVDAFGPNNWYINTYRCHALALLLGATPDELMAELYGRKTGNAQGRGGSMHLYTSRMLGGFAIVGGHIAIAAGAAFSLKYQKKKGEVAICFLGDGAVAQGTFHETLNMASLWNLPVIYIIENNQWGMGTHVSRALSIKRLAEQTAPTYNLKGYTLDGMDFFNCYLGFDFIKKEVLSTSRPVVVECVCERFRGHSISDAALYRTKEELTQAMKKDPIDRLRHVLEEEGLLTEQKFKEMDKEAVDIVKKAMAFAEKSPWPNPSELETEVYAP